MKKFVPRFRGAPWVDGMRVLHVYLLPDLNVDRHLAQLVTECREAMRDYPIALLDDDRLHATIEMVADAPADRIDEAERKELVGTLSRHLVGASPFEVTAGSPLANKAGALLDLHPDEPLVDLKHRVQAALREARGPATIQHDGGRHHISLGYAWGTACGDPLQSALRRITPSHASFHVTQVHLLDVVFRERPRGDEGAWEISWEHVAALPLDAGQPDGSAAG